MTHDLGGRPFETLRRVARYYLDKGYSPSDARLKLDRFMLECDPFVGLQKWSDTLDRAVSRAIKCPAVDIDSIDITAPEMDAIDALDGKQTKRLAFALLCLAKYWMIVRPNCDYWVNNRSVEIMELANISTSIKAQGEMFWALRNAGLIKFSKQVDNTSVRVCFATGGDVVVQIRDFRNLGYQYMMYHGEPYFVCVNCGITTKSKDPENKRRQKYCPECAAKMRLQQHVDAVMRFRKMPKNELVVH